MGAFVCIAIILFPYYLKTNQILSKSADKESQIEAAKEQIAASKKEEAAALKKSELDRTIKKRKVTESEIEVMKQQAKALQEKIEKSVQFVFLGLETDADSFTLLLDMSKSMRAYKALTFDTADRIINSLKKKQKLSIIGFNISGQDPTFKYWPSEGTSAYADLTNKQAASKFIRQLSTEYKGGTPTYHALQKALESSNESIVLLTDGIPSYPTTMTMQQIKKLITTANNSQKEIHTIGLGEFNANPTFLNFLEGMAKQNGGGFLALARE